jgi:diguanylate cyclase (GGDEF)-like protein
MGAPDDEIAKALEDLKRSIASRVRVEQLRDQLTKLPNGAALSLALKGVLDADRHLWAAFIEVDRFKSINDRYGYENADALLLKIAEQLSTARSYFHGAEAFRAHGDEFFLMGPLDEPLTEALAAEIERGLDVTRSCIGQIRLTIETAKEPMRCTVSVGWLTTHELELRSDRIILQKLETAVAEAKRKRDRVVRYTADLAKHDAISLRADCSQCDSRFALDVKRTANRRGESLRCPNCGASIERPPEPVVPPGPTPPTV